MVNITIYPQWIPVGILYQIRIPMIYNDKYSQWYIAIYTPNDKYYHTYGSVMGMFYQPGQLMAPWPRDLEVESVLMSRHVETRGFDLRDTALVCRGIEIHSSLRHPKEWDFSMDLSQLYHDQNCGFKMVYHDLSTKTTEKKKHGMLEKKTSCAHPRA